MMGSMSETEPHSGVRWFVADRHGIVTDPTMYSSGEDPNWVPPNDEDYKVASVRERPKPPAPGTGTISISPVVDEWYAIWDYAEEGVPDSYRSLEGPAGMTREQAIEWALGHAAGRIMIHNGEDWVPVTRPPAV